MPEEASLNIFLYGFQVGRLWLDERRRFAFQYGPEWLDRAQRFPISLSLPLQPDPYLDDRARPFFANLLPEGEIRRLIARQFHLSEQNDYTLLEKIGGECAGAVSILPDAASPSEISGYREVGDEMLHSLLLELPKRPLLAGDQGIRLSLAGAQNKLPVYMEGEKIYIPTGNSASTHILKPPIPGLEQTVENEAFCMTLAAKIGLPTAPVAVRSKPDLFLVVTRYDRQREKDGTVVRLHQEDFCQATGILPEAKYESEGGPSLAQCFALLKEHSVQPAGDQKSLLGWVIFNVLIGNADAHAKNLSILFTNKGPRLAPFYDLLSTNVYPDLTGKLAMKIGGENRISWLQARHWERLADEISLKRRYVLGMVRDMTAGISAVAETEGPTESWKRIKIVQDIVKLIGAKQ
jgi:serine/threonine-protein kinase HipA